MARKTFRLVLAESLNSTLKAANTEYLQSYDLVRKCSLKVSCVCKVIGSRGCYIHQWIHPVMCLVAGCIVRRWDLVEGWSLSVYIFVLGKVHSCPCLQFTSLLLGCCGLSTVSSFILICSPVSALELADSRLKLQAKVNFFSLKL